MEVKKNPNVDLEKSRGTYLLIGLASTLLIIYLVFNYTTHEAGEIIELQGDAVQIEEEIVPITRQQQATPPPPPPAAAEVLNIVEDDVELEEELEIEDTESDEDEEIEIIEVEEEEETDEVFQFAVIEDKPEFPGGEKALLQYLVSNTKYPEISIESDIQGTVYVQFVIDKSGKVTDVQIARGVDKYLDKEAIRVVKSMPPWKPGKQRGKAVKVQYFLPVKFVLG
jgi:protein TonB